MALCSFSAVSGLQFGTPGVILSWKMCTRKRSALVAARLAYGPRCQIICLFYCVHSSSKAWNAHAFIADEINPTLLPTSAPLMINLIRFPPALPCLHVEGMRGSQGFQGDVVNTIGAFPQVQDDIVTSLRLHQPVRLVASFNRPNITYTVIYNAPNGGSGLAEFILGLLPPSGGGATIVYTLKRDTAQELSVLLTRRGTF